MGGDCPGEFQRYYRLRGGDCPGEFQRYYRLRGGGATVRVSFRDITGLGVGRRYLQHRVKFRKQEVIYEVILISFYASSFCQLLMDHFRSYSLR